MPPSKNPLVRLGHIRDEINQLAKAIEGASYETFARTYVLRRTTEHAILIISEAAKALAPSLTDPHPSVDWRALRDIGNILRHEYFEVDPKVLWRIVTDRLPELRRVITQMIEEQQR